MHELHEGTGAACVQAEVWSMSRRMGEVCAGGQAEYVQAWGVS